MPLLAALTPEEHEVFHTDEVVEPVRFDRPADLVGITAPTPSALHAYALADEFRRRGVPVVLGGPHATALPDEALAHADAVVTGEAEDTWPRVLEDAKRGSLSGDYCSIPLLYGPRRVRYRPVAEVVAEVARAPTRAVVFWDDNIGADPRYAKDLFRALAPLGKWWTSQGDSHVPEAPRRGADPDRGLVAVRREEALRLPAEAHVARGARRRDGVGGAAILLSRLDLPATQGLARRDLVERPAEPRVSPRAPAVRLPGVEPGPPGDGDGRSRVRSGQHRAGRTLRAAEIVCTVQGEAMIRPVELRLDITTL